MPNVVGPKRSANHAVVSGSASTIGRPPRKKLSTSDSLPDFASSRTNNATFVIFNLLGITSSDRNDASQQCSSLTSHQAGFCVVRNVEVITTLGIGGASGSPHRLV